MQAFSLGIITASFSYLVLHLVVEEQSESEIESFGLQSIFLYYFTACLILVILGTAFCIQVFRDSHVNYMFIFELDTHHTNTQTQFYTMALVLLTLWTLALTTQLTTSYQALAPCLLLVFTVLILSPFEFLYKEMRLALLKALWQIALAPFGQVKFRHFFLADVVTSMGSVLKQQVMIWLVLRNYTGVDDEEWDIKQYREIYTTTVIVGFIPSWFRFA